MPGARSVKSPDHDYGRRGRSPWLDVDWHAAQHRIEIEGREVPAGALDVAMYRDDIGMRPPQATHDTELPFDLGGKVVVLVDDVLYTGRTVRAALDALTDFGRPRAIQLAVLVDRGHRELPLRADYVGKNLPTAPDQAVKVLLAETDGSDGVVVEGPARKAVAS